MTKSELVYEVGKKLKLPAADVERVITIPARKLPYFKPFKALKEAVNGG